MPRNILSSCVPALLFIGGLWVISPNAIAADAMAKDNEAIGRYTQDIIDRMDSDKNGEVSKAEFLDFMSKEFDALDVNHDGKLQQKEIVNKEMLINRAKHTGGTGSK